MTPFEIARVVHIVAATLWVGGGIAIAVGAEFARHKRGPDLLFALMHSAALMGPGYFMPVSMLTLVSGIVAAWLGPGFSELWIILGLGGAAATFLIGLLVIKPRSEGIARLLAAAPDDTEAALTQTLRLMNLVRFDHIILLLVVAVMALKPSVTDSGLLLAIGAILALGAVITIPRIRQTRASHRRAVLKGQ